MTKPMGLRQLFFMLTAAGVIILGVTLSFAISMVAGAQIKRDQGQRLAELAFHLGDTFDRGMWSRQGELAILVDMEQLRVPKDIGAIRRLLDRLQSSVPMFSWVGYTTPEGMVLAATGGVLEGQSIAHRPVYAQAVEHPFIGDVHDAKMLASKLPNPSGDPMRFVDLSFPVHGPDGRLAGVLAAHLSWQWAQDIARSLLDDTASDEGIDLFILNRAGEVLLGPKDFEIFNPLQIKTERNTATSLGGWNVETWPDGIRYLSGHARERGYQNYPGLGWTILARQPTDQALAPVRTLQLTIAAIGGLFAILFVVMFWFLVGSITRPLNELADAADRLAELGEGHLPRLQGTEEIHRLSASLRALVLSLTSTRHQAHHDRLTGLANRAALDAALDHLLPLARRNDHAVACLYLDLDGFKPINDTLGHKAGDAVLQDVALRLKSALRGHDVAVRLGGDEFLAVIMADDGDWQIQAKACAERIIAALSRPMTIDGHDVKVGASVGIAAWPLHGDDFPKVMAHADQALYAAKRGGKNRAEIYTAPLNEAS